MIIETKEVYKCEHCKKLYQKKHAAEYHELLCYKNPENKRPCFGCPMLEKKTTKLYYDHYDGEHTKDIDILYCNYKKSFMYPPKNAIKGNAIDLGDEDNIEMPKECDVDLDTKIKAICSPSASAGNGL